MNFLNKLSTTLEHQRTKFQLGKVAAEAREGLITFDDPVARPMAYYRQPRCYDRPNSIIPLTLASRAVVEEIAEGNTTKRYWVSGLDSEGGQSIFLEQPHPSDDSKISVQRIPEIDEATGKYIFTCNESTRFQLWPPHRFGSRPGGGRRSSEPENENGHPLQLQPIPVVIHYLDYK